MNVCIPYLWTKKISILMMPRKSISKYTSFVQRMPKDNHKRKGNENKRPFIKIPSNL